MAFHIASVAYKIVEVGFERNIRSYTLEWVTEGAKKFQRATPEEHDECLAYADVVMLSESTADGYSKVLSWYKKTIGLSNQDARALKPKEKLPMVKHMRVYWYHTGTNGMANNNVGWRELIESVKIDQKAKENLLRQGDASAEGAYRLLKKLEATGKPLACRPVLMRVQKLGRTIIASLAQGQVFLWAKGAVGNRGGHLWVDSLHGAVVSKVVEHKKELMSLDSAADFLCDLQDSGVDVVTPIAPNGGTVSVEGLITKRAEQSKTGSGRVSTVYSLPDGTDVWPGDSTYFGVARDYFKQDNDQDEQDEQDEQEGDRR